MTLARGLVVAALASSACAGSCSGSMASAMMQPSIGPTIESSIASVNAGVVGVADTCDITAATGYTPVLHYAARLETGFANNDPATPLNDWGSQGDDISQGTGAAQPTYKTSGPGGRPYISCDGGDFLESTSALDLGLTTFTVCCVSNAGAAVTSTETVYADDLGSARFFASTATSAWQTNHGVTVSIGTSATNTWTMGCTKITAGAGGDSYWIDGVQSSTTDNGANDVQRARLCGNSAGGNLRTGAVAECAVWSTAAIDVDALEAEWESAACYGNNFPFAGTP